MPTVGIKVQVSLNRMKRFQRLLKLGLGRPGVPAVDAMYTQWGSRYSAFIRRRFDQFSRGGGDWPPLAASTIYARSRSPIRRINKAFRAGDITSAQRDIKLAAARGRLGLSLGRARQVAARINNDLARGRITGRQATSRLARVASGYARRAQLTLNASVSILRDTGTLMNALSIDAPGNVMRRNGPQLLFGIGGPDLHPGGHATIGRIAAYHNYGGAIPGRPPRRVIITEPTKEVRAGMRGDAQRMVRRVLQEASQ